MGKSIEKTAKTVEEAVALALEELNAKKDNVDIEIIDEGTKGIFGLGSKEAKVKVEVKDKKEKSLVKDFLKKVFEKMDMDVDVLMAETEDSININLEGENMGLLIGRRGETLDALQYLVGIVANKGQESYKKVILDTENYRQKREETLVKLANKIAERVVSLKKSVTLEPMNPYERRIIHSTLQENKNIETYSVGEEPNRKVVIALK